MTSSYEVELVKPTADSVDGLQSDEARSIGAIVTSLWEKTESLVRQEMKLGITEAEEKVDALKIELEGKVERLKLELLAKATGGLIAFAGLLSILAAIVLLLAMAIKPWLAAFLVGAAFIAGGSVLLKRELKLPAAPSPSQLIPERTIETLKQDFARDPKGQS